MIARIINNKENKHTHTHRHTSNNHDLFCRYTWLKSIARIFKWKTFQFCNEVNDFGRCEAAAHHTNTSTLNSHPEPSDSGWSMAGICKQRIGLKLCGVTPSLIQFSAIFSTCWHKMYKTYSECVFKCEKYTKFYLLITLCESEANFQYGQMKLNTRKSNGVNDG